MDSIQITERNTEIRFTFEIEDWLTFNEYHLINSKRYKIYRIVINSLLPVLFSAMLLIEGFSWIKAGIYAGVSFIYYLVYGRTIAKRSMARAKKVLLEGDNSSILGEHIIIFDSEGIKHVMPTSDSLQKWNGIVKIAHTETHIFLYNSAISAHIIPIHKTEMTKDQILDLIEKERKAG